MDCLRYPIIFGCHDKADKAIIAGKDKQLGGYSVMVCRLKEDANIGDHVEPEDCECVIARMNFQKLESARALLVCAKYLVEEMEKEHDREGI